MILGSLAVPHYILVVFSQRTVFGKNELVIILFLGFVLLLQGFRKMVFLKKRRNGPQCKFRRAVPD